MKKQTRIYIISVAVSLGVGILSALLTRGNMNIYEEVSTPPLSPPSFLFPVVWTVLYVLMGISAAMVLTTHISPLERRRKALYIYGASLFFNFFWSIIFFNIRAFLFSFVWLLVLLALIILTIVKYYKINKTAAYLQIPYAVWVTFAGYLNFGIWLLNK
ncbi:MAG: tryptophan-rich sensory protein [Clostridia bacterium]|nr:tryptophan-rich sensory protein [Clostridia bacterium]